jgi:hypothetical protein
MIRMLLLVVGLPLLFIGSEGLYHAARNRQQTVMTCDQFARNRPTVAWIRLTACDVDYVGAGYRESRGRITELLFPVRPARQERNVPAAAIVATQDENALAIAQRTIGGSKQPNQEAFLVMMLTIVTSLKVSRQVDGYARVGIVDAVLARRIVAGLAGPIDSAFVVIDLYKQPPLLVPALEAAAGALALLVFLFLQIPRRSRSKGQPPATDVAMDPSTVWARRLRGLMLLNLPPDAGLERIETAPPLGSRADVIDTIAKALPGIRAGDDGSCTFNRPDHRVTISLGSDDPVVTAVIEGQGDLSVAAVRSILEITGWRVFAPRRGAFIDAEQLNALMEPEP